MSNLTSDIRAEFAKNAGLQPGISTDGLGDNNYRKRARNAANTGEVDIYRVDAEDNLHIGGSPAMRATWRPIIFRAVANGAIVTTRFHIFGVSGRIKKITEIHNVAGNDAAAVTLHITKEIGGQAPGAGTSVMSGTFNLKGTLNTEQTATLSTTSRNADATLISEFTAGQMLSVKLTGTATTAAGVLIVIWVQYDLPVFEASWWSAAVTSQDQGFFISNRPYPLRALSYVHAVAETTDATANVQVTKDSATDAPGAGGDLLTNDTNAGFDINATANVVQAGAFATTTLVANDRLGLDFNSTQTEGAGICITATFNTEEAQRVEVPYWLYDTDIVDNWFFSADRSYDLWDGRFLHAVAAGGTSTMQIEKTRGTTDASGGTVVLATAVNLNATANTVQVADYVTVKATALVSSSERLSVDYANTEQSTVGVLFTLSLRSR